MTTTILDRLMSPLPDAEFCERYWQRRAVHVRGPCERLAFVPDLDSILAEAVGSPGEIVVSAGDRDPAGVHRQRVVDPRQAAELLANGFTLQVNRLATRYPALAHVLGELRRRLRHALPGDVAMFASNTGSGYALHFDAMDLWIVQTQGRKRWWYSPLPATPFPADNVIWDPARPASGVRPPTELQEIVLEPGDVLYLPGGSWHTAEALEPCTHVALSFKHYDVVELLLTEVLDRVCQERATWRSVPTFPDQDEADADVATAAYLALRVEELRELLGSEEFSPRRLSSSWRGRVAGKGGSP